MAENITTVPNLPEAGDPSLSDLLYLVQGEGSDRDRKVTLERLRDFVQSVFGKISCTSLTVKEGGTLSMTYNDSQAGNVTLEIRPYATLQDKTFRISLSGSLSALKVAQKLLLESGLSVTGDAEVSGTISAKTIEGTNAGTSGTYLVINNLTVSGDLDAKGNAMLGNGLLKADYDYQKVEINGDAEVSGTLSADGVKTAKISPADGTATVQVTGVLDTTGVKATTVTTDSVVPKTAGNPVALTGSATVSGSLTASGSVTAGKIACSKLSLKDNGVAYAPAMPYFVDTSTETSLSRLCSGSPSGGRVTLVNATDGDKTYTFSGGANGKSGHFTLKAGRAVDLLVFATSSSTTSTCVPIGVDFSTGG